jgi:hypothetical protein
MTGMGGVGRILVEILNLLLLLGFRGGWSVERPEWRKIKNSKATVNRILLVFAEELEILSKNKQFYCISFQ